MKWLSILVALVLVLCLVPLAYGAEVTGKFTIVKPPNVTEFNIYDAQEGGNVVVDMDPNRTYYARATVYSRNTLNTVQTVKVTLFYDVNGGSWDPNEVPTSGDLHDCAILTWDKTGGWSIDAGGSTKWALVTDQCVVPNLSQQSGTWVFAFKVGNVARASVLNNDDWRGVAVATNTKGKSGDALNVTGKNMNFASEITVSYGQGNQVVWEVEPGLAFTDSDSQKTGIVTTYIANGPYNVPVWTTDWTGDVQGDLAILDWSEEQPSGDNEFGLKAWVSPTLDDAIRVANEANADNVVVSPTEDPSKPGYPYATDEDGEGSSTNTLWLALSENWTNESVEYTGDITFNLTNQ